MDVCESYINKYFILRNFWKSNRKEKGGMDLQRYIEMLKITFKYLQRRKGCWIIMKVAPLRWDFYKNLSISNDRLLL